MICAFFVILTAGAFWIVGKENSNPKLTTSAVLEPLSLPALQVSTKNGTNQKTEATTKEECKYVICCHLPLLTREFPH